MNQPQVYIYPLPLCSDFILLLLLLFAVILDSHAVVRNSTERFRVPFTQFPPMVTSCKTIVQYRTF